MALAQSRSGHLVMWDGTKEAVSQNRSALDKSIRERKGRQFFYWPFAFLSLTCQDPMHLQSCCLSPPRQLLGKPGSLSWPQARSFASPYSGAVGLWTPVLQAMPALAPSHTLEAGGISETHTLPSQGPVFEKPTDEQMSKLHTEGL